MVRDPSRKDVKKAEIRDLSFVSGLRRKAKGLTGGIVSRSALMLAESFQRSFGVEIAKVRARKDKKTDRVTVRHDKQDAEGETGTASKSTESKTGRKFLVSVRDDGAMMALEPRIVFDAAGAATAEVAADDVAEQQAAEAAQSDGTPSEREVQQQQDEAELVTALGQIDPAAGSSQIAFIDGNVENIDVLLQGIDPSVEVILLQPDEDGIEQIASALQGRTDIDAIHIISHGSEGELQLGNSILNANSIQGDHLDELTVIGDALSAEGDILIYGCNFTGGEAGLEAAMLLGGVTGADIASSTDVTGSAELGGDWDLETNVGQVEADEIAVDAWDGTLADQTVFTSGFEVATATGHVAAPYDGWSSNDGTIEHWEDGTNGWTTPYGTGRIELNDDPSGTFPDAGDIFRDVTTISGAEYTLTYSYGGRPGFDAAVNDMNVLVAGAVVANETDDATANTDIVWTTDTVTFTGTGGVMRIAFEANGTPVANGRGMMLDNVSLVRSNMLPTATDDAFSGVGKDDGAGVVGNALTSDNGSGIDSDPDGDALTVIAQSGVAGSNGGVFSIDAAGAVTFDPNGDFDDLTGLSTRDTTLTYTVSDGYGGMDTATITVTVSELGTNDAPIATNDAFDGVVKSDGSSVLGNALTGDNGSGVDTDPENDPLTVTAQSGVAGSNGGLFTIDAAGEVTFDPNGDFNDLTGLTTRDTTLTYTISDGNGGTDTATITVTVQATDGWSLTGTTSIGEGGTAQYTISFSEAVAAGNSISVDLTPAHIDTNDADFATALSTDFVAAVNAAIASRPDLTFDGTTLTYTAPAGAYTANYDAVGSTFSDISVTGTPLNIADDGNLNTNIGFNLDFYGTTYTQLNVSDNGFVTFGGAYNTGSEYINEDLSSGTAMGGLAGIAAFWDDMDPSAAGNVDVFVQTTGTPGNQQFVVQWNNLPIWGTAGADTGTIQLVIDEATGDIRVNYPDVDFDGAGNDFGASATVAIQDGSGQSTQHSFNTANSVASGSSIVFGRPSGTMVDLVIDLANFDDTATEADEDYSISLSNAVSSLLSSEDQVETTIVDDDNNPPTATDDAFTGVTEDDSAAVVGNALTADNGSGIDSDPDGDTLTVTPQAGVAGSNGGTFSIDAAGVVTFDPDGDFEDLAVGATRDTTLTYEISDGNGGTDTATITVTVSGVNDAPTATNDAFTGVTEDDGAAVVGNALTADNGSGIDSDPDGDTLTVTVQTGVAGSNGGTFSIDAAGVVTFDPDGDFEDLAVGATRDTTLTYQISDGNGGTDTATITVTVSGVNDAPTATDDAFTGVTEDDGAAVVGNALTADNGSGIDSDPDGDTLTVTVQTGVAGSNGGTFSIDAAGVVTFDPDGDFEDLAVGATRDTTLTYQISDGNGGTDTATITVTVSGVNDAPTATDDAFTGVTEDDGAAVVGNALTADNGSGIDSDPDGDALTVTPQTGVAGSNGGTFSIDAAGVVTFDPDGDFEDLAVGATRDTTLTYQISDGNGGTDTATITVTVSGVNDAPTATDDAFTGVTEDDGAAVVGNALTADNGSGIDSDPDGDTLTVTVQTGVAGSNGGTFSIDAAGVVTFDPDGDFEDLAVGATRDTTLTYQISDGNGGTDTATITVTVSGVNDAPTATNDAFTGVTEDDGAAVVGNALTADNGSGIDSDPDGDTLTVTPQTGVAGSNGGTFSIDAAGVVTFDPDGDFEDLAVGATRDTTLTYQISDGNGGTDTATITVTVSGVNDAPTATDDAFTGVTEDDASAVVGNALTADNGSGIDSDPDGDTLTVTVQTGVAGSNGGTFSIDAAGVVTFDPDGDFEDLAVGATRDTTLTYQISDGNGGTDTATITVTVSGVNDAPTATNDAFTGVTEDDGAAVVGNALTADNGSGIDSDPDGDTLTVTVQTGLQVATVARSRLMQPAL